MEQIRGLNPSTRLRIDGERPSTALRTALSERSESNGRSRTINIPKRIYFYDEGIKNFNQKSAKDFIIRNFGDIKIRFIKLKKKIVVIRGLLFDLMATQNAFANISYSKDKNSCHIILTNSLFSTVDSDNRPHIRSSIYSCPSIISASGIVEGPAKPREYYLYKQKYTQLGLWDLKEGGVKNRLKECFIDYGDKRINQVLKGYITQALFFYITGEPFCKQKSCRLYNAHWQEDLIYAQIKSAKFCSRHQRVAAETKALSARNTGEHGRGGSGCRTRLY